MDEAGGCLSDDGIAVLHKFTSGWGWVGRFKDAGPKVRAAGMKAQLHRRMTWKEGARMRRFDRREGTDDDWVWFKTCFGADSATYVPDRRAG